MTWRLIQRPTRASLLAGLATALVVAAAGYHGLLEPLEARTYDWRLRVRRPLPPRSPGLPRIVLVEVTEQTYQAYAGQPRTFWGDRYASAIRRLGQQGALVIGLDVLPTTPVDRYAPELDEAFAAALMETPGVVMIRTRVPLPDGSVKVVRPHDQLLTALTMGGGTLGFNNFTADTDQVVRRQLLVEGTDELTFAVCVAAAALHVESGRGPDGRVRLGTRLVGQPPDSAIGINFRGPAGTYPRVAFEAVAGPDGLSDEALHQAVQGAIALIGFTSVADQDVHSVPFGGDGSGLMPGVEIHANIVDTLLHDDAIRALTPAWCGVGSAIAAFVLTTLFLLLSPATALAAGLLTAGIWTWATHLAFGRGLWLPLPLPLAAVAGAEITAFGVRFLTEQREKRRLRTLFDKSVSKSVVDALLQNPGLADLTGERRVVTVLFSDIRNFTTLSEKLDPQKLSSFINRYLTRMTRILMSHDGTTEKYIGDAIVALFGAPVAHSDDPERAVRCAVEMWQALPRLREEWVAAGIPEAAGIEIGIGVHTGEAFVGTVGAPERLQYAAIGDTTNVAARVEGLNKEVGSTILISAATYAWVHSLVRVGKSDMLKVKGRTQTIQVYEILGLKEREP